MCVREGKRKGGERGIEREGGKDKEREREREREKVGLLVPRSKEICDLSL